MIATKTNPRRVALICWGNCIEEQFLDTLGVSLAVFLDRFLGSWAFGYIEALRSAGVETTCFFISARQRRAVRLIHKPTNCPCWFIPPSRAFRVLRRWEQANGRGSMSGPVLDYAATPLIALARRIREEKCDVILIQGHDYARFDAGVFIGKILGLPVYTTYQGGADGLDNRIVRRVRGWTFAQAAGFIVPAEHEASRIARRYGVEQSRLLRIMNPINPMFFEPSAKHLAREALSLAPERPLVVWHGRIDVGQKGLDLLLDAFRRVRSQVPDALLAILGSGPDRARLRQELEKDAEGVVWFDKFALEREEIRTFLSAADIFAFPSRAEGFAVAPVEAMARALPVVAFSWTPGIRDLFVRGEADGAILVDGEDSEAFSVALLRLIRDEPLRRLLGAKGQERAKDLSSARIGALLAAALYPDERPHAPRGR